MDLGYQSPDRQKKTRIDPDPKHWVQPYDKYTGTQPMVPVRVFGKTEKVKKNSAFIIY